METIRMEIKTKRRLKNEAIVGVLLRDVWLVIFGHLNLKSLRNLRTSCVFFYHLMQRTGYLDSLLDALVKDQMCSLKMRFGPLSLLFHIGGNWGDINLRRGELPLKRLCMTHRSFQCKSQHCFSGSTKNVLENDCMCSACLEAAWNLFQNHRGITLPPPPKVEEPKVKSLGEWYHPHDEDVMRSHWDDDSY